MISNQAFPEPTIIRLKLFFDIWFAKSINVLRRKICFGFWYELWYNIYAKTET